ncbi:MAG: phosphoglycerate mutase family protein [Clostridia bacterium]|jgi:2,3-bisphosphoglycerate-dependent phosphoglycerate mutase|nr:phosphoglycerate mutase family protein [Clostridia bacterium]
MHIFLIRHGESIANNGSNYVERIPDHLVELSDLGKQQSREAGIWLAQYCKEQNIAFDNAKIWRSPYLRTRQTSEEFNLSLKISNIKEEISLIEQQFGLFDCISDEQRKKLFPKEYEEYQRQRQNNGRLYAKLPQGESPFDVAIRIQQFIEILHRDYQSGIDTFFVFTHGTALRAFLLRYFNYSTEWFEEERNPKNCWIREIKDHKDCGYINL